MMVDTVTIALFGMNAVILASVLYNSYRVGKLEGRLKNGDFLRCPFYRARNKGCNDGEGRQSNKKTGSSRQA